MITATATRSLVADLLLVRLLVPSKQPPGPKKLREDLDKVTGQVLTSEAFSGLVEQLRSDGLITVTGRQLTEKGQAEALEFLGAESLAPRTSWKSLQARYLFPKALNVPIEEAGMRLGKVENVVALLLKLEHQLPAGTGDNLSKAMDALACQQLGYPEESTLEGLKLRVLSRFLGVEEKLSRETVKRQLPRVVAGTPDGKMDTLRGAVIRRWAAATASNASSDRSASAHESSNQTKADFDLATFAATVKALARDCPTGRFGDNKVFIASVYHVSQQEPGFPRMGLPEFKARLLDANHQGLLQLSRADLVQAMDPALVRESEARLGDDVMFHFILLQEVRP